MSRSTFPFLHREPGFVWVVLRNNVKVFLLFNVLWVLAYRTLIRTSERFVRDLASVGVLYMAMVYVVVHIRELRHFLPLAIIVVPLGGGGARTDAPRIWSASTVDKRVTPLDRNILASIACRVDDLRPRLSRAVG